MAGQKNKNKLSLLFFAIGIGLLAYLIHKVGLQNVLQPFKDLGWNIFYVFLFPITWYSIQSFAWWRVLKDDKIDVSYFHVFLAKITGEAINTVTPVSFMGGDPYRIYMLQKKVSGSKSTSSVVIDRTMYMLAVLLLLFTAMVTAWINLPMPQTWKVAFPIFTAVLFLVFVIFVRAQNKGLFGMVAKLLHKLGVQRKGIEDLKHKIEEIDHDVGRFYRKHKAHFFEIMILQYIGRALGIFEIYLIVQLMGYNVTLEHCLYLASLTILINMVFVFIPGSMGVMEGGYGALFHLLKLNSAYGIAIQLVRRVRAYFWIGIGLLIILFYKPQVK